MFVIALLVTVGGEWGRAQAFSYPGPRSETAALPSWDHQQPCISPQASASCWDLRFCHSRLGNSDEPSCPRQLENVDLKRNLLKGVREQTEEWKVAWPGIGGGGRSREVSLHHRSLFTCDLWLRIRGHCWPSCGMTAALNSGHREEMQPSEPGLGW